jgi:hypothetical protein
MEDNINLLNSKPKHHFLGVSTAQVMGFIMCFVVPISASPWVPPELPPVYVSYTGYYIPSVLCCYEVGIPCPNDR